MKQDKKILERVSNNLNNNFQPSKKCLNANSKKKKTILNIFSLLKKIYVLKSIENYMVNANF